MVSLDTLKTYKRDIEMIRIYCIRYKLNASKVNNNLQQYSYVEGVCTDMCRGTKKKEL